MSREKTLFIIAILVMIVPHLGLTNIMEEIVLFVFGIFILLFAYGLYFSKKKIPVSSEPIIRKSTPRKRSVSGNHPPMSKDNHLPVDNSFTIVRKPEPESDVEVNNFNI